MSETNRVSKLVFVLYNVPTQVVRMHGAQSDVRNREGWHDNKAVCGEIGRKKNTMEYEKLLNLLCFVNEFPKTKRRKYPQYISE